MMNDDSVDIYGDLLENTSPGTQPANSDQNGNAAGSKAESHNNDTNSKLEAGDFSRISSLCKPSFRSILETISIKERQNTEEEKSGGKSEELETVDLMNDVYSLHTEKDIEHCKELNRKQIEINDLHAKLTKITAENKQLRHSMALLLATAKKEIASQKNLILTLRKQLVSTETSMHSTRYHQQSFTAQKSSVSIEASSSSRCADSHFLSTHDQSSLRKEEPVRPALTSPTTDRLFQKPIGKSKSSCITAGDEKATNISYRRLASRKLPIRPLETHHRESNDLKHEAHRYSRTFSKNSKNTSDIRNRISSQTSLDKAKEHLRRRQQCEVNTIDEDYLKKYGKERFDRLMYRSGCQRGYDKRMGRLKNESKVDKTRIIAAATHPSLGIHQSHRELYGNKAPRKHSEHKVTSKGCHAVKHTSASVSHTGDGNLNKLLQLRESLLDALRDDSNSSVEVDTATASSNTSTRYSNLPNKSESSVSFKSTDSLPEMVLCEKVSSKGAVIDTPMTRFASKKQETCASTSDKDSMCVKDNSSNTPRAASSSPRSGDDKKPPTVAEIQQANATISSAESDENCQNLLGETTSAQFFSLSDSVIPLNNKDQTTKTDNSSQPQSSFHKDIQANKNERIIKYSQADTTMRKIDDVTEIPLEVVDLNIIDPRSHRSTFSSSVVDLLVLVWTEELVDDSTAMPKSNSLEKPALVTDSTVLNMVRRSRNSMSSNQHQSIAQEEGNNTAASTACEKVICETRTKVSTSNNSNSVDGNIMKEEADTNCFQAVAISLCSSSALSRKGDCAFTRSCPALKPMQEDEIIKEVVENIVQNVLQETIKLSGVESKSDTVDAFANGSFVRHIPISKKYRIPKKSSATMSSDEDQMTRQQRTAASSQIQTNPYDSQPNRTSRLSIHHQVANKCASTSKDPVEHDLKGFPKPLRNSYEVGKQTTQTICNADISLGPHMINNSKPGVKVLLASTAISKLASSSECHLVENFQSHADEIACDSNSCNELMSNPDLPAVSFFSSNKELEESTKEHGNHLTTKPHIHSEKEFSENKGKDYSNLPSVSVSSLVSSKNRTASAYEVLTDELLDPQNSTSDFSLGSAEELTESPPFSPEHTVISYDRKRSAATQVIASGNIEQQKFCHEKVKNCSPTEGKLNHNLPQKNRTEPSSPDTKKCQQRSCHSRKPKKHQSVQGRGLIDGISSDVKQPFQTTPKGQSYDKCSSAEHLLCHTKKRSQSKDKHIENESQHRSVSKESQSSRGSLVQYRSHKTRKSSEHHSSEEKKYIKNDSLVSREKLVEHRSHGKTSAINQLRDYRNCKKQTSERFFLGSKASSSRLSHDSIKSQKSLLLSRRKTVDQRSPNESIYHESWSQNKWLDVKRKSHDERKFDRGHSRSSRSFLKDRYKTPAKQQSLSRLQHFENQAFATRKSPGGESYMMENQPRDKAFVEDITEGSRSSLKKFHRSRESQESELFHNGHSYEGERSSKSEARDKGQSLKSHLREIGHKDRPQKEGTTVQGQSQDGRTSLGHPSFDSCLISDHHARTKISRHQSEGYGEKVSAMDDASKTRNKLYEKHRYPSHLKEKLLRREGVYSEKKEDHGRLKNCSDHLLKERRGKRKLFDSGSDDGTKGVLKRCRRANPSHDKLLQEDLQSSRRISKECRRDYVTAPEQSNMKRPVVDSFAGRTESNISGCQQLESIEEFEKSTATSTVEGGLVLEEGELVSSDEERSKTPSEKSFQRSKSRGPHSKSPRSQSNSDKSKSTVVRSKYRTEESRRRP